MQTAARRVSYCPTIDCPGNTIPLIHSRSTAFRLTVVAATR